MAVVSPIHMGVRALQALSAVLAMVFTSLGYIDFDEGQLSSGAAIFATVANYSAMVCGLYYAVALGALKLSAHSPRIWFQRATDFVLMAALVLAGALHATTRAVRDCAAYNQMFSAYHNTDFFRCGHMTAGIVFTFATAALVLATLVLSFTHIAGRANSSALNKNLATEEEPSVSLQFAAINTPSSRAAVEDAEAKRPMLRTMRRGGRALQLACSLVALVATVAGYHHYFTGQYLAPSATFVILMAYTCASYALWHLLAVETLKLARRPALTVERVVDGALAMLLLVAAIIFVTSAAVKDCDTNNTTFFHYHGITIYRCGGLGAGAVFTFIAVFAYAATFALSFFVGGPAQATTTETADRV